MSGKKCEKYPTSIGIQADLHCGSQWGIMPPKWTPPKRGGPVHANIGQQWMWKWWIWQAKAWRDVLGGDLDLLVLNADIIDGKQPKAKSTGLITPDLIEQADIAYHVVSAFCDIAKPKKVVRTTGTAYHEPADNPLGIFDEKMGIKTADDEIALDLGDGRAMHVQHNPGSGAVLYKGTAADREILWSIIAEALKKAPSSTHIIRSHVHYGHIMMTHGKTFVLTPCWQLQSRFARKRNRYRWTPDLGGVLLRKDESCYGGFSVHMRDIPLPVQERRTRGFASL